MHGAVQLRARILISCFVCVVTVIGHAQAIFDLDLKALYEAHEWRALNNRLRSTEGIPLYQGAIGVTFNQDPRRTESLLLSVISAAPHSPEAYDAAEWLSHLYLYRGQYRSLVSIMEGRWAAFPDKSEKSDEQAAINGFRGYLLHGHGRAAFACDRIKLSQAEVEDLHATVFGQKNVFGFEIAMNHSCRMGRRQTLRDAAARFQHLPNRHRTVPQPLAQRLSLQKFGDDVGRAVIPADMKDRDNVGMIEGRGSLRFDFEASQALRIARPEIGKDLNGHIALERGVAGAIYLAHSPCAEGGDDFIGIQLCTRWKCHRVARLYRDHSVPQPDLSVGE